MSTDRRQEKTQMIVTKGVKKNELTQMCDTKYYSDLNDKHVLSLNPILLH